MLRIQIRDGHVQGRCLNTCTPTPESVFFGELQLVVLRNYPGSRMGRNTGSSQGTKLNKKGSHALNYFGYLSGPGISILKAFPRYCDGQPGSAISHKLFSYSQIIVNHINRLINSNMATLVCVGECPKKNYYHKIIKLKLKSE